MSASPEPICRLAADPSDRQAWADAVDRYADLCWRIALRMLGDREAAACAVQDCMLAVRASAIRFTPGDGDATAWVARIAVNTCHAQRAASRPHSDLATAEPDAAPGEDEAMPHLRAAIAELPDALREAVSLRYLAGLGHADVGASLGIDPGTARVRVHRALEALRCLMSRRRCALSALAIAGTLDRVAEAAVLPPPAGASADLAAAPLPAVARPAAHGGALTIAVRVAAVGCALGALALGATSLAAPDPGRDPPVAASAAPAPVGRGTPAGDSGPAADRAGRTATAAGGGIDPFAGGLSGWAQLRGSWRVGDGAVIGTADPGLGARLVSQDALPDGVLTCRLRLTGAARLAEIQIDDYHVFFTVRSADDGWIPVRLWRHGDEAGCTAAGVELPPESEGGDRVPGKLAFYVIRGGVLEIADLRLVPDPPQAPSDRR